VTGCRAVSIGGKNAGAHVSAGAQVRQMEPLVLLPDSAVRSAVASCTECIAVAALQPFVAALAAASLWWLDRIGREGPLPPLPPLPPAEAAPRPDARLLLPRPRPCAVRDVDVPDDVWLRHAGGAPPTLDAATRVSQQGRTFTVVISDAHVDLVAALVRKRARRRAHFAA
jgi:hypothetical protein